MSEATRSAPRRLFEDILGPADWTKEADVLASSVTIHHPVRNDPVVGIPSVRELFQGYRASFPDMIFDVDDEILVDRWVTLRWRARGTHTGAPLLGNPPTNRKFDVTGISVFRIERDRIQEGWIEENSMRLLQQLGHSK
jgi:predicted ester cyclase